VAYFTVTLANLNQFLSFLSGIIVASVHNKIAHITFSICTHYLAKMENTFNSYKCRNKQ